MVIMEKSNITVASLRAHLPETTGRVTYAGERIIVTRNGKPVFAVISIDDLEKLEQYEVREKMAQAAEGEGQLLSRQELTEYLQQG